MEAPYLNKLIHEKSPYLLQHAHNPVDWQAWGDEAFARAVAEDKPVLLSIGYSTCHWCHVMADESFSDPVVAEIMNRAFVSIKLDREERPDIDHIYISAVSALNGSAGWPLNVFLTPAGRPFYGGTYFPPVGRPGLPAWKDVLLQIERAWNDPETRKKILASAEAMADLLAQHLSAVGGAETSAADGNDAALIQWAVQALGEQYEKSYGGFSRAPKFPMPPTLGFLLAAARLGRLNIIDPQAGRTAREMARQTLQSMAAGGIVDHLGGGFHRYSTDERWHLPHFEKMLYDNAQLAAVYLDAQDLVADPWPAETARHILDYMKRDLMRPGGGFYSAEDADSYPDQAGVGHKREGAFYGWRLADVQALLPGQEAEILAFYYDLRPEGNVRQDPLGEFQGINVLYHGRTLAETAARFNLSEEAVGKILEHGRDVMLEARIRRPRPHLDDKILTAWNGLAISALSKGYMRFGRIDDLDAARDTAAFIHDHLYDPVVGGLKRRWRDGESGIDGLAEDYIYLIQGLLDLYQAGFDSRHLAWALDLAGQFYRRFYDEKEGVCFTVSADHDPHLFFRPVDDTDNVLPSVTSTAALVFQRLARLTEDDGYGRLVERLLDNARHGLTRRPGAAPLMLAALAGHLTGHARVVIYGAPEDPSVHELIAAARSGADRDILLIDSPATIDRLEPKILDVLSYVSVDDRPTAYVCADGACHPPVGDPEALRRLLP